jgi:hypothetical protein
MFTIPEEVVKGEIRMAKTRREMALERDVRVVVDGGKDRCKEAGRMGGECVDETGGRTSGCDWL